MDRKLIPTQNLQISHHQLWRNQGLLLTCGDFKTGDFNCMSIGWGSIGTMWTKPFMQVVVRPTRYTHVFMEKYPSFTVCAFSKEYRNDLHLLGTHSGRDCEKLKMTNLRPIASTRIAAPGYVEAELIIECRKIYSDVFKPEHFIDATIFKKYPLKDYHTVYFGAIEAIFGQDSYCSKS